MSDHPRYDHLKEQLKEKASKAVDDSRAASHAAYSDAKVAKHNENKDAKMKAQKGSEEVKTGTSKGTKKGGDANIEEKTRNNTDFRRVLYNGK